MTTQAPAVHRCVHCSREFNRSEHLTQRRSHINALFARMPLPDETCSVGMSLRPIAADSLHEKLPKQIKISRQKDQHRTWSL
ncbi:hypothetical protein GCG54_00014134 [Colletotrichum gloeosporioides]|uniref:C2H2-type domain-containing protein n=1 Tax=Colletotrichum gloeosporioides TaxID=474922 RepID=A0A8H4CTP2_COLGL|nr:uncharacterized protein GCG54_00014134 [Colletotrichum gloeosporioides]KAF3809920.1 hypothetical protein GCG54_00014134 [Colletotrichum gloeosporioides]